MNSGKFDPEAVYRLAMKYIYGDGVEENNDLAAELLRQAAEAGHIEAQYNLGVCLHYGYGAEIDTEEAQKWYEASARQGYARGMVLMGRFLRDGTNGVKDEAEAFRWFRQAVHAAIPDDLHVAEYCLGECYERGIGVCADAEQAFEWYAAAAKGGNRDAQAACSRLYRERE